MKTPSHIISTRSEVENLKKNYTAVYKPVNAEFTNCTHGRLIIMSNTRDLIRAEGFV